MEVYEFLTEYFWEFWSKITLWEYCNIRFRLSLKTLFAVFDEQVLMDFKFVLVDGAVMYGRPVLPTLGEIVR